MHSAAIKNRNRIKWIFVILLLFFCACSVKKNYKVLSIFFDGVPNPNQPKKTEAKKTENGSPVNGINGAAAETPQVVMLSRHPDFVEKNCKECHDIAKANLLKGKGRQLCFSCHDESDFGGVYVHGPIAGGGCTTCHLPHESQYESLLKNTGSQMCLDCHMQGDLSKIESHEEKEGRTCVQCHLPHAAGNRFFLKKQ